MEGKIMRRYILNSIIVLLLVSALTVSGQKKEEFKANPTESKLNWTGSKPGGQHHGTVQISEGTLNIEKGEIKSGFFTIDLRTIKDLDLEPGTWNDKLVGHLKSEDFFYIEKYPVATFKLTNSTKKDKTNYSITGDLTIRGITHPVTFDATVNINKGYLTATSSEIVLDRVKWDIKTMSKSVFADLKDKYVDDEMLVTIDLVANSK
jgi:polyisoprenoid-binding protein YceI